MYCVPFNGYAPTTWRMLIILVISSILAFENFSYGVAAASALKYSHHGPLPSALSGRSVHEGGSGNNNIAKTIISSRGTGDGSSAANTNNAVAEGGGGGEILVPKTFPLNAQEPTCEQLRAMWIFSKRQSRAAEITNEIPTYRDPFAYNVWEPYYSTTRSLGTVRMVPRFSERSRSPVFGRVISREPLLPQRITNAQRQRHMGVAASSNADPNHTRFYGSELKPTSTAISGRRTSQYRYVGNHGSGSNSGGSALANGSGQPNSVAVQGSFQKLKELIWTERAKELTQQRRAEEMAARAAVLKEIANGQNIQAPYKPAPKSDSYLMDENRSPDRDIYEHMNDDHRTESIASGQSQILGGIQDQKKHNNLKNIGASRSYVGKSQKSSSVFSSNNGGRSGRHMLPGMIASGYSYDDTGIPKSYPMRPSHFRERNRSLFKQHSPSDYFQRDARRKVTYGSQQDPVSDNFIFQRLVNELNQRILEKQRESESNGGNDGLLQQEDNRNWLDDRNSLSYDEEPLATIDQYTESEETSDYY